MGDRYHACLIGSEQGASTKGIPGHFFGKEPSEIEFGADVNSDVLVTPTEEIKMCFRVFDSSLTQLWADFDYFQQCHIFTLLASFEDLLMD